MTKDFLSTKTMGEDRIDLTEKKKLNPSVYFKSVHIQRQTMRKWLLGKDSGNLTEKTAWFLNLPEFPQIE